MPALEGVSIDGRYLRVHDKTETLGPVMYAVMDVLLKNPAGTPMEQMYDNVYRGVFDPPDDNSLAVCMNKLRNKLHPHFEITSANWGGRYMLRPTQ